MPQELTHLEKRTLIYLGFKGEADEGQLSMVRSAVAEAKRLSRPQFVYRFYELFKEEERYFIDAPLDISYPSLQRLFAKHGSDSLCILVSTLGGAIDKRISSLAQSDPPRMVLLDAASNALIEEETDSFQKRLGLKDESFRFAPGYGDVPLSMQKDLFELIPEISRIGIELDDGFIMHPFKSMTGLIGFKGR